jgi:menaquinone-dependent protoporphyrinogen IX oxidase
LKNRTEALELAGKTLIAYQTKGGATEEAARKIAETLRSKFQFEVDLVDLKEQKHLELTQYQNVIVGVELETVGYMVSFKFLRTI